MLRRLIVLKADANVDISANANERMLFPLTATPTRALANKPH
jgi:hypothetical protein